MRRARALIPMMVLPAVLAWAVLGCASYSQYDPGSDASRIEAPPPWEQSRSIGEIQHYYYYPQVKIYFNLEREVYVYYYEGQWQVASQLPSGLKTSGRRVSLGMYDEEPFKWQAEIEKVYPPEGE